MRIHITLAFALLAFALPVQAQDGNVTMGYFVTTDLANVVQFEEGMREHVGWHADQNDPWPGLVYQAMHGGLEYVWVAGNHTWAAFGNPPVDPAADQADFAERAGAHATGLDLRTWVTWTDVSRPPAADAVVPLWEVIEWDLTATSEGISALQSAFAKVKEALDEQGAPLLYTVNHVVGIDGAPQMFVAIAHESLDEMDASDPGALESLLVGAYGHADGVQVMRTFEAFLTPTASRIWMLRTDLSHMPGM
jgi:hypothetical protein